MTTTPPELEGLEAVAPEDEDPLEHIGDEANPPEDIGRAPAPEDVQPPAEAPPALDTAPEVPAAGPGAWRPALCLAALKHEVNARWPHRSRRTDGFIGNDRHCPPGKPPKSDHCVNSRGVVRAFDITADGIKAAWLAEHIRTLGKGGDSRLANGGYVIFNRRIASWSKAWRWRHYRGDDPHTSHIHVSVSRDSSGYDNSAIWGVATAPNPNGGGTPNDLEEFELGSRVLRLVEPKMRGTDVDFVQRWVGAVETKGVFGVKTKERVQRFQRIVNLEPDGIVGPLTWRAMRVT